VPPHLFTPDLSVDLRSNRLTPYRGDLILSATRHGSEALEDLRMKAVFFWQGV